MPRNMRVFLLYLVSLLYLNYSTGNNLTIEYYVNLLSQTSTNVQKYEAPQNNSEFIPGIRSDQVHDFGSYDFIIVGAGSAGSVLANRLSEVKNWNILLLEAGGEENDLSKIPAAFMYLHFSDMNWGYYTTPQTNCCLGMKNSQCIIPRGKSIGGSSAINAMMYVRGNPKDYDQWAQLGNPGWSYKEVLPYFIKSESSKIDGDYGYHGKDGLWSVEHGQSPPNTFQNFIDANAELNIPNLDYNGRRQFGVSKLQLSKKRGVRHSTGSAFLEPARKRQNLKVITKVLVTKINIDAKTKTAQGVYFVSNNIKFIATATKEVIVSAGSINSPQLLMLSGIGPKNHLKELGIDVIQDLPVGENLIDHPMFPGLIIRTNATNSVVNPAELISQYLINGSGPLTYVGYGVSFLHKDTDQNDPPMIEYLYYFDLSNPLLLHKGFNYNSNIYHKFMSTINATTDFLLTMALLHPKSRGRITLKSNSPIDFPNINLNMLAEPEDVDNIIKGIEFVKRLLQTTAFRKINGTLLDIPICTNYKKQSKKYWTCVIRQLTTTIFHPVGTTPMGPNKTVSVVDTNLKVHGVEKLRIVDAGVFPNAISGHTSAPTVMIAEKISDVIKSVYKATTRRQKIF